ncbi:hypothetical protein [uncultured Zhongshania sp.]|uniref:hypothetical protein n=1 Tax=uncultured Zhongshania sp. TaxID=1642288 RepID=UPI0025F3D0EB|nr:hypothetical protein [uncultured Zhongshania sp.]
MSEAGSKNQKHSLALTLDPRSGSGMTWFLNMPEDIVQWCHPKRITAVILDTPPP